jgi:hypothetical protein
MLRKLDAYADYKLLKDYKAKMFALLAQMELNISQALTAANVLKINLTIMAINAYNAAPLNIGSIVQNYVQVALMDKSTIQFYKYVKLVKVVNLSKSTEFAKVVPSTHFTTNNQMSV